MASHPDLTEEPFLQIPDYIEDLYDLVLVNIPDPVIGGTGVPGVVQALNTSVSYHISTLFSPFSKCVLRPSSISFHTSEDNTRSSWVAHMSGLKEQTCSGSPTYV